MIHHYITPIHLFERYDEWLLAIESAKGDLASSQLAWNSMKEQFKNFEAFCEFIDHNQIENWVYANDRNFYVRIRLSALRDALIDSGFNVTNLPEATTA